MTSSCYFLEGHCQQLTSFVPNLCLLLGLERKDQHFADDIFKFDLLKGKHCISKFVPKGAFDKIDSSDDGFRTGQSRTTSGAFSTNMGHINPWGHGKIITIIIQFGMELLIQSHISTEQPLKFENGWVIFSHTILGMWLVTPSGIKVNPCW